MRCCAHFHWEQQQRHQRHQQPLKNGAMEGLQEMEDVEDDEMATMKDGMGHLHVLAWGTAPIENGAHWTRFAELAEA